MNNIDKINNMHNIYIDIGTVHTHILQLGTEIMTSVVSSLV